MSNDFFSNHPVLGSVFDLDDDGSMNMGEAAVMNAAATEFMRTAEDTDERPAGKHFEDATPVRDSRPARPKSVFDVHIDPVLLGEDPRGGGWYDIDDVDVCDGHEVARAVSSGDFSCEDCERLVQEALDMETEFSEDDVEDICWHIRDWNLKDQLRDSLSNRGWD